MEFIENKEVEQEQLKAIFRDIANNSMDAPKLTNKVPTAPKAPKALVASKSLNDLVNISVTPTNSPINIDTTVMAGINAFTSINDNTNKAAANMATDMQTAIGKFRL